MPFAACYIDDICVHSKTEEEHLQHLRVVFQKLKEAGLTLNTEKCEFFKEEAEFLGFLIKGGEVKPTQKKVSALKEFPSPKNEKELKRFLGLAGYYRSLVPNFAVIAIPLYKLLEKKTPFRWKHEQEEAFVKLKMILAEDASRFVPDLNRQFIVKTDASENGIGALLVQETDQGYRRVAEYASKKFGDTEKRYPVIEQEAAAIMFAVDRWRHYLLGKKFKLETDHKPLAWLRTKKNCLGKLGRWALKMEEFDYEVVHVPGRDHEDADALSRVEEIAAIMTRAQKTALRNIKSDPEFQKEMEKKKSQFIKEDSQIMFVDSKGRKRLCLAKEQQDDVWRRLHDKLGHVGPEKVLTLAEERFYWPKMLFDLKERASKCVACSKGKDFLPVPRPSKLSATETSTLEPFERVSIDAMTLPNSEEGYRYVLVLVDCFTKWIEVKPVKKLGGEVLIEFMNAEVFSRHGHPKEIVLDRGSDMESKVFKQFCENKNIKLRFSPAYHHQANPVERVNRTLWNLLRVGEKNPRFWSAPRLREVTWIYRVTKHSAIGVSPFEALYGRKARLALDLEFNHQPVELDVTQTKASIKKTLKKSEEKAQEEYNAKHKACDKTFKKGQLVLMRKVVGKSKLDDLWTGPYVLAEQVGNVIWKIEGKDNTSKLVHENLLKEAPKGSTLDDLEGLRSRGRPKKKTN